MSELLLVHHNDDHTIGNLGIGDSSTTNVTDTTVENNTGTDIVDLMDISINKKWICYVRYTQNGEHPKDVKISRKRLKAFNKEKDEEEYIPANDKHTESKDTEINFCEEPSTSNTDFDLTNHYESIENQSRFLSISSDGNFIALSSYTQFYERWNSSCLIFKVVADKIVFYTNIKYRNGRAVFLNRKKGHCLAIITQHRFEIYTNLSECYKPPDHFYDLVGSSKQYLWEYIAYHKSYFKNASWAHFKDEDQVKDLMTFSRHIRHDVITTPFIDEGIVRLWSIKDDGVRLTSFSAPNEHVVALSKELKYAATIRDGVGAVKIYNIKNGLLVYTLQSRFKDKKNLLEVTHVRFCYESRYLVLSGLQKIYDESRKYIKTEVVFEVWYIEAEKSIYGKKLDAGGTCEIKTKTVKPFVLRDLKENGEKCLKGVYTFTNQQNEDKIYCVELKIDEELKSNNQLTVEWLEYNKSKDDIKFSELDDSEIENDINDNTNLKCANIIFENKRFYIRFGTRMIQLWKLGDPDAFNDKDKNDQLIYIRAYKGPSYGRSYSFRETWVIKEFDSIKFIEGTPTGRMILNIKQNENQDDDDDSNNNNDNEEEEEEEENENKWSEDEKILRKCLYHTDEIFLPLTNDDEDDKKFDYHTFESACQALHYLNCCWEENEWKIDISSWDKDKDGVEEDAEFELTLIDFSEEEKNDDEEIVEYRKIKKYKENLKNLFVKTFEIIHEAVTELNYDKSNYFATMAGSRTLAMLADFPQGREIIKLLLKRKDSISFNIFSYTKELNDKNYRRWFSKSTKIPSIDDAALHQHEGINYRNSPQIGDIIDEKFFSISENENVLTVLIDNVDYDLYKLMFNRILSDSKKIGPGCLTALADALLFLQFEGHTDLLLSSSQKLSYLAMDINILGVLPREKREIIKVDEYDSKIRNLECDSTMEQLKKCSLNLYDNLYYKQYAYYPYHPGIEDGWDEFKDKWKTKARDYVKAHVRMYIIDTFRELLDLSNRSDSKNRSKLCVIPLPYFNTYNILLEDRINNREDVLYKHRSAFVAIASNQNSSSIFRQGDTVLMVMLKYKWEKFLRIRFIFVCLIHAVYYITYCTGVLFASELHDYKSGEDGLFFTTQQLVSIICMAVSGFVLLFQELRQIIICRNLMEHLFSGYNWVDFATFTFPFFTLLQLVYNWDYFYEACSITTLILWLHAIIRLRVVSFVGITLETIIQLSQKVWSILFIFLLVVLAFTHSFIVLFRHREDTYFQETFDGVTSMYSSDTPISGQIPISVGNTTLHDVSSDNGFKDPFKAFYQVWLVIFGVWDPLINGEAGDDKMVFVLCMLFALITVLIFTNMVIALMSSTVDEVKNKGNTVWVSHFASVVAEVEQLWCLPSTRRNRNNNPSYIYYTANHGVVKRQEEMLEDETKELRKKVLGID